MVAFFTYIILILLACILSLSLFLVLSICIKIFFISWKVKSVIIVVLYRVMIYLLCGNVVTSIIFLVKRANTSKFLLVNICNSATVPSYNKF